MLAQLTIPPENMLYVFKLKDTGCYRYYDTDIFRFSAPGFLGQIINVINPDAEFEELSKMGYDIALDGTVDILVLDRIRCNIADAGMKLKALSFGMN